MPAYILPVTTETAKVCFAALDGFTQAYIEALCWTECSSDAEDGLDGLGFSEMLPATVEGAKADCEAFQRDNAALLQRVYDSPNYGDETQAGHDFWLTRNHHGVGFWDRDLPDDLGDLLTNAAHAFGEVDIFRDDFIAADQIAMSPHDAWLYAATWGSFVTSGDPGACMYGFDETCRPQSEEHRANVLAWIADCRTSVEVEPDDYDDDELDNLDSFVRYITQAALAD